MNTLPRAAWRGAGLTAAGLLVVGLSACGGSNASQAASNTSASGSPSAPVSAGGPATGLQQQYESVIRSVLPSVVEITTSTGLGSGIVYDNKGDIVTNDHVVGAATSFQVQLANQAAPVPAALVGTFPADDLAVIKVNGIGNLHPATFANSAKVPLGQIVLAMGNPLGFSSSVTEGIVSGVGRTLVEPQTPDSPGATLPDSIQTSAAINPGNSGGALVNLAGQVIGIPTLAATDQQQGGAAPGIGFAIPADLVTFIAPQLIGHGTVTNSGRAALGIEAAAVANQFESTGVGVAAVTPDGAAAKAGIAAGDIITKIDGTTVSSVPDLTAALANLKVGQQVTVVVQRGGASKTFHVTLGQLPGTA